MWRGCINNCLFVLGIVQFTQKCRTYFVKNINDKNIYKVIKILYNYSANDKTFIAQIKFLSRKGEKVSSA
jgi:hypothetical protein